MLHPVAHGHRNLSTVELVPDSGRLHRSAGAKPEPEQFGPPRSAQGPKEQFAAGVAAPLSTRRRTSGARAEVGPPVGLV